MKIYKYSSHEEYIKIQTKTNREKINNIWVTQGSVEKIKSLQPNAEIILCHGTRNATEQKLFCKYYPEAKVFGTEISDTALSFPMTMRHDFHEPLRIFNGNCDIVYSNSFDHSYDPEKCLKAWHMQKSPTGKMFIELMVSDIDNRSTASDPLEISEDEFLRLCSNYNLHLNSSWLTEHGNSKVLELS